MQINGTIYSKVEIDPIDVINGLISELIGHKQWIIKEDKKYVVKEEAYRNIEVIVKEITKEQFDYYKELESIKKYLKSLTHHE